MHTLSHPSTNEISHSLPPIQHKIPFIKKPHPLLNIPPKLSQLQVRLLVNCAGDWFRPSNFHNKPLNLFLSMFESLLMLLSGNLTLLIHSRMPNFLSSLPNIRLHDPVLLNPTITILGLPTWVTNEKLETSFNLLFPSADFSAFRAFRHRPNARNPSTRDWLIQVPSNVFPMLNKSKNVHFPLGRFPFYSRIHPTRCLNCQTLVITYLSAKILEYVSTAA